MNKVFIILLIALFIFILFSCYCHCNMKKKGEGFQTLSSQPNFQYLTGFSYTGASNIDPSANMPCYSGTVDYSNNVTCSKSLNNGGNVYLYDCMNQCNTLAPECTGGTFIQLNDPSNNGAGVCYLQRGGGAGMMTANQYQGWGYLNPSGTYDPSYIFGFVYEPINYYPAPTTDTSSNSTSTDSSYNSNDVSNNTYYTTTNNTVTASSTTDTTYQPTDTINWNNYNPNVNLNYNVPASNMYNNGTYNHYTGLNLPPVFYGPNGQTGKINFQNNQYYITIISPQGQTTIYQVNPNQYNNMSDITSLTFYSNNGGYLKIIKQNNSYIIIVYNNNNVQTIFYSYNFYQQQSSQNPPSQSSANWNTCNSSNNSTVSSTPSTYPQVYNNNNNQKRWFPNKDLYALKTSIVTPKCPVCKEPVDYYLKSKNANKKKKKNNYKSAEQCPPCPACARCPEPSFECKKVPNYKSTSSEYMLPVPVLNDFSSFGM